ncbi:hypothetical protein KKA14_09000 [bacterium]|nr:hypothetical protein [bacterium]
MLIHCVGDSHTNFFSGYDAPQPEWPGEGIRNRYDFFRCYRIGPVLAYNLCDVNTTMRGREKLLLLLEQLQSGSHVMFCFGEIDCRAHIVLQSQKQNKPTLEIVKKAVSRYFSVIREVRAMGFHPLIWNVVPSAPSDINAKILLPSQYLFHGTCEERNSVTRQFNTYLKDLAGSENIFFLDVFDYLMNEDGSVKREYYRDEIHLGQQAMPLVLENIRHYMNGHT